MQKRNSKLADIHTTLLAATLDEERLNKNTPMKKKTWHN